MFRFLKTEEEALSTICLEPRSKRDHSELQANFRHFELSRKRIAARMRLCQCMSHFVYDLRSSPLVRDRPARVCGQIMSDHCRYDLTGHTQRARAGCPYPEVNLPEPALNRGRRLTFLWQIMGLTLLKWTLHTSTKTEKRRERNSEEKTLAKGRSKPNRR